MKLVSITTNLFTMIYVNSIKNLNSVLTGRNLMDAHVTNQEREIPRTVVFKSVPEERRSIHSIAHKVDYPKFLNKRIENGNAVSVFAKNAGPVIIWVKFKVSRKSL